MLTEVGNVYPGDMLASLSSNAINAHEMSNSQMLDATQDFC